MRPVRPALLYALLLAVTIGVYLPLRHNGFVDLDDVAYITDNAHVRRGLTGAGFTWAWTTLHGKYWQPLSWLSLQWDAHWFSSRRADVVPVPNALAFHAQSLFWHSASVLLLFGLLLRLTGARWPSFLAAALFALHPLRVESVAWAAERKDVLSVFFGLVTLHAYVWYCRQPSARRYAAVAAAFAASLLCKPMLMTLPAVLLLLDIWPLRRIAWSRNGADTDRGALSGRFIGWVARPESAQRVDRPTPQADSGRATQPMNPCFSFWIAVAEKLPVLLLSVGIAVVTLWARYETSAGVPFDRLPISLRLIHVPTAYGWYITHTFYPLGLAAYYPHPEHNWSPLTVAYGTCLLAAVTGLSIWQVRRRPWILLGWLWFLGTLLPVIGLTQGGEQGWADRFTYWPHIGLLVAIVWTGADLAERRRVPVRAAAALGAAVLAGCAVLTWVQIGHWRDAVHLWQRVLAVSEDSHHAHFCFGRWYMSQGEVGPAQAHFAAAVAARPDRPSYQLSFGLTQLLLGRPERAVEHCQLELALSPRRTEAWHVLGLARLDEGKPEQAVPCFRKVLELAPGQAEARSLLGHALWRSGHRAEAMHCFEQALAANTVDAVAWYGMALVQLARGANQAAIEAFSRAMRPASANPALLSDVLSAMGIALGRTRNWQAAAECHMQAIKIQAAAEERLARLGGAVPAPLGVAPSILFECRCAFALKAWGDQRTAAGLYRSASQRDPQWPGKFAAIAWRLATDAAFRDPQLAYEYARQAIEGSPGQPAASLLDALAASEAALGQYTQAVQSAQQALSNADAATAEAIRTHLKQYEKGEPVTIHSN